MRMKEAEEDNINIFIQVIPGIDTNERAWTRVPPFEIAELDLRRYDRYILSPSTSMVDGP
jgi:hypothetical protein